MRVARYTTESVTGSMMYRAARSLVASSVGDENMSESSWREHYTGTDLFAFVTFDATLEAAVCLGRSEDSRRKDEKTVERWARRARFHSWLEWFRIRTPFARVPVSFFTNFILAVRAEDNTFFLPITASLTVGVVWRRSTAPASSGAFASYKGRTPCVIVTIFLSPIES